jgi:hypothetical protein
MTCLHRASISYEADTFGVPEGLGTQVNGNNETHVITPTKDRPLKLERVKEARGPELRHNHDAAQQA